MIVVRSIDGLVALREPWERLASRAATPLLGHAWMLCAAQTLHREDDLRIVGVHRDDRLVGVAPLVWQSGRSGGHLMTIGASALHEPGGLLFEDGDALDDLLIAVSDLGVPAVLPRVPAGGELRQRATNRPSSHALWFRRSTRPSLGVSIGGTWDDYWRSLSRRVTDNLPRLERRAVRQFGSVEATVSRPPATDVDAIVDAFVTIEASGWKGRGGSALRDCTARHAFFRSYAHLAAARGELRITTVRFGDAVAAMEMAIQAYDRVWQLKIGFDDRFAAFYPGLLLTKASIHAAFVQGLASYEFLGSAEAWEERWRPEARPYDLLLMYPLTARGLAGICRDAAVRVGTRLPALAWRPAARVPQATGRFA